MAATKIRLPGLPGSLLTKSPSHDRSERFGFSDLEDFLDDLPCKSAHIAAAKTAKDVGAILSYDPPNLRIPLCPCADNTRDEVFRIWDTADIIKEYIKAMISSVRRKGGPYTNQGDDLSHGKRLEEVIWRLLQILKELLLSCARSTPLNRLDSDDNSVVSTDVLHVETLVNQNGQTKNLEDVKEEEAGLRSDADDENNDYELTDEESN
uniref:Uncharacterized protein n=1 Tax=Brassica oleracea var. oleracea TaxID=109376 RepID=A0A0D3CW51_BRAOL